MKHKIAILGIGAIAAGAISACGDGNGQAAAVTPPTMTTQSLDTAQVLAQAKLTSETRSPYAVNAGALVLTDVSDTAEPVSINGS